MDRSTFPGAPVALVVTGALFAAAAAGLSLSGSTALVVACGAILSFGLPHGALDIELIRNQGTGGHGFVAVVTLYLAIVAVTATAWLFAPVTALAGFIVIAVFHFADDWKMVQSRFLSTGLGVALIAAPTLLHRDAVADIFIVLTGDPSAAGLASALFFVAPMSLAIAVAGIAVMIETPRFDAASAAAASLIGLVALPPIAGFAVFFCLFHSPRHFIEALAKAKRWRVERWMPVVLPVTLAAGAIVTAIFVFHGAPTIPERVTAATFMALAILTVPHMLAPLAFRLLIPSAEPLVSD